MSSPEYYHNKGQEDYWKGVFEPPNEFLMGYFNSDDETAENKAYIQGWHNAKEQDE